MLLVAGGRPREGREVEPAGHGGVVHQAALVGELGVEGGQLLDVAVHRAAEARREQALVVDARHAR
ncbi:MAG: hypothetical protein ACK559_25690, partial [bacterium]